MPKRKKEEIYRVPSDDFIVDDEYDEESKNFEIILKLPEKLAA